MIMKKAVVLTSGGLDSTTCLALAIEQGFEPISLSFNYGQRHAIELDAAARIAQHYGVQTHLVADVGLFRAIGQSALTDDIDVPQADSIEHIGSDIPVTYVPARNLVFLSMAVGVAETQSASAIFIGVNALDYSGYPDCRPEFIDAFQRAAVTATKWGVDGEALTIETPLIHMTKAEIIQEGLRLRAPYHLTHSCYAPTRTGLSCGRCDSCLLRLKGFTDAGATDPIGYEVL